MIPLPLVTGLFSLGKSIVSGWLQKRAIKVEHKVKMAEMKLELKEKRLLDEIVNDAGIDNLNTENMATSWKDEFLLLMFSVPVILCFIPGCDVYVLAGFAALNETPVWYQVIFVVMSLTIYGHRKLARLFAGRFLGVKDTDNDAKG